MATRPAIELPDNGMVDCWLPAADAGLHFAELVGTVLTCETNDEARAPAGVAGAVERPKSGEGGLRSETRLCVGAAVTLRRRVLRPGVGGAHDSDLRLDAPFPRRGWRILPTDSRSPGAKILTRARAQIRSRRSASAAAGLWWWTPSACLLLLIRPAQPARLRKRVRAPGPTGPPPPSARLPHLQSSDHIGGPGPDGSYWCKAAVGAGQLASSTPAGLAQGTRGAPTPVFRTKLLATPHSGERHCLTGLTRALILGR